MNWFHELSSSTLAVIFVVATLAVSITGLALTAARVRETKLHEQLDNGTIAGLLAALVGIYAIAAGLTAVAVWGNTQDAGSNVAREAAAISVLFHDLGGYPQPMRTQSQKQLADYTRYVIEDEWPLHQHGMAPTHIIQSIEELKKGVFGFEPTTESQKAVNLVVMQQYNRVVEMRHLRLQAVGDTALPGALWAVVILLGVIAISSCFLLRLDSFAMHAAITTLVAAPIALILYFIAVTDRPFQGGVSVSSEPYRIVLEDIMIPEIKRGN
jgi:hypothetical protein